MKISLLVPRNVEKRIEKLRQNNLKILQQEVITLDTHDELLIDENFLFEEDEVRTLKIIGNIKLWNMKTIPKWFRNVHVVGNFSCFCSLLSSLKNSPYRIDGILELCCFEIFSLDGMTKVVNGTIYMYWSKHLTLDMIPNDIKFDEFISTNFDISMKIF